jgi:hypothetical protein
MIPGTKQRIIGEHFCASIELFLSRMCERRHRKYVRSSHWQATWQSSGIFGECKFEGYIPSSCAQWDASRHRCLCLQARDINRIVSSKSCVTICDSILSFIGSCKNVRMRRNFIRSSYSVCQVAIDESSLWRSSCAAALLLYLFLYVHT